MYPLTLSKIILSIGLLFSHSILPVDAHIFNSDESASFISLSDHLNSALLAIRNNSSNGDDTKENAIYARSLLNDSMIEEINEKNQRLGNDLPMELYSLQNLSEQNIDRKVTRVMDLLSETLSARIETDQLHNSTIHALAAAGNVDKILKEYSSSFNQTIPKMSMGMKMNLNESASQDDETALVPIDKHAYYRSLVLTNLTIDRFISELNGNPENASAQDALHGLEQLRKSIKNGVPPNDLLGIIHGQIHPNLQKAFGLELA